MRAVPPARPPEGVILSGGAAWAAYEVGIMLSLLAGRSPATSFQPISPVIYSGTSAGSLNAAAMVSAWEMSPVDAGRRLEQLWLREIAEQPDGCGGAFRLRGFTADSCWDSRPGTANSGAVNDSMALANALIDKTQGFLSSSKPLGSRLVELLDLSVLVSADPLWQLVREHIDASRIRSSPLRLRVAATNWRTGQLEIFSNKDFADPVAASIIAASSAVPGVFAPVAVGSEKYVDGGIFMNTPLRTAVHAGADILHVIYLEPDVSRIEQSASAPLVALRSLGIANAANISNDLDTARRVNNGLAVLEKVKRGAIPSFEEVTGFAHAAEHLANLASGRTYGHQDGTGGLDPEFVRAAHHANARIAGKYRPLTVHVYHPHNMLGGPFGMANLKRDFIRSLIELGYADATRHDCRASGCIIPAIE